MKGAVPVFRREVLSFFVSPVGYFLITGFALLCGYFFFNMLQMYNMFLQRFSGMPYPGMELPNLNQWVVESFYHTLLVILVFLIPMLTMRSFAEEKRRGTFELLATSPLSIFEIVLGKFLAVAFVLFLMMLLGAMFPLLLVAFGKPGPELFPVLSGFLGLYLCALGFAAVGLALSAFTENQIVAGVSSLVVLLLLYVAHSPAESVGGAVAEVMNYISPARQAGDLFRGIISTSTLIYFVSLITVGLFVALRALEAHRWR
ncbi:MAG: ABC transporter permease [Bdellovibrionota bacterium]|nr:MAG: ABC transporter permease [Bdellovibrionota bacterium]